jgi:PAS domain-containing protein
MLKIRPTKKLKRAAIVRGRGRPAKPRPKLSGSRRRAPAGIGDIVRKRAEAEAAIADARKSHERLTTDGGIIGLRVAITELKQREASFRLLFDSNPVPMIVCGLHDERILGVNDAAARSQRVALGADPLDRNDGGDYFARAALRLFR